MAQGSVDWADFERAAAIFPGEKAQANQNFDNLRRAGVAFWDGSGNSDTVVIQLRKVCRNIGKSSDAQRRQDLNAWREEWHSSLPLGPLQDLEDREIDQLSRAYGDLRWWKDGRRMLGPTASGKFVWAVAPEAGMPWDQAIRDALGVAETPEGYSCFLDLCRNALSGLARNGMSLGNSIPEAVGRPDSTASRLLDEYLWRRLNGTEKR